MPLRGLSNQWKTFEGLIDRFAAIPSTDAPDKSAGKYDTIRQLLIALNQRTESVVYVGTSHGRMNFSSRDVLADDDSTQPFAYVDAVPSSSENGAFFFRVERRRIDRSRPTSDWRISEFDDVNDAVDEVLDSLNYAETPVRRPNG